MLSADAESPTLSALDLPDVDAIKVPHHGSADSGLADVLRALRPEVAVIEVGENTYGHPAPGHAAHAARPRPARTPHRPRRHGHADRRGGPDGASTRTAGAATYTRAVAELKPVYLISGDDDAKIDAWRGRVRARAERELGPGGLEQFDAKADGAAAVAGALATMTFAEGTRYLLAEPVEGWKADDIADARADARGDAARHRARADRPREGPGQAREGGREAPAARCASTPRRKP